MDRFILGLYSITNIGHPGQNYQTFINQIFIPNCKNPLLSSIMLSDLRTEFLKMLKKECVNLGVVKMIYQSNNL